MMNFRPLYPFSIFVLNHPIDVTALRNHQAWKEIALISFEHELDDILRGGRTGTVKSLVDQYRKNYDLKEEYVNQKFIDPISKIIESRIQTPENEYTLYFLIGTPQKDYLKWMEKSFAMFGALNKFQIIYEKKLSIYRDATEKRLDMLIAEENLNDANAASIKWVLHYYQRKPLRIPPVKK